MATDGIRTRNLFDPASKEPYKLSRSKLELFLQCPRCFYLDRRSGIGRPDGPAFSLNIAVDALMKREFDFHRARGEPHALMEEFDVDAVPFSHPDLDRWRENFHGMQVLHTPTNFLVTGAVDDVWQDPSGKLSVVDYKATSTQKELSLDDPWKQAYKRQIEIYQWLLRGLKFDVSNVGYFVFVNADSTREHFKGTLSFAMSILPYVGDSSWVSDALAEAHHCLMRDSLPAAAGECDWCKYRKAAKQLESD